MVGLKLPKSTGQTS